MNIISLIKPCNTCSTEYPRTAKFYAPVSANTGGLSHRCRRCTRSSDQVRRDTYTLEDAIRQRLNLARNRVDAYNKRKSTIIPRAFDLTFDEALDVYYEQDGVCPVTSVRMSYNKATKRVRGDQLSLDRIANDEGYYIGNVQWVTNQANTMMSDQDEYWFSWWVNRAYKTLIRPTKPHSMTASNDNIEPPMQYKLAL